MCTSDDPRSELEYHKRAAEELDQIKILPTWRPDPAFKVAKKRAEEIYNKAREEELNQTEVLDFQAFLMDYFVDLNKEKDWVMHLHIGAVRNYLNNFIKNHSIN